MKKLHIIVIIVVAALAGITWKLTRSGGVGVDVPGGSFAPPSSTASSTGLPESIRSPAPSSTTTPKPYVLLDVPFTSQAPSGQWSDLRFQDGCEEASLIMAMRWIRHSPITAEDAESEIIAMSSFEERTYGPEIYDRSAKDTAQLMRDYYKYKNVSVKNDVLVKDIVSELAQGNLVIVPVDGQKLKNPYYTAPGPVMHMLVVIGYDTAKRQLITNDPGTRHGKQYRYDMALFESAMRDYPTGFHEPITSIHKNI